MVYSGKCANYLYAANFFLTTPRRIPMPPIALIAKALCSLISRE